MMMKPRLKIAVLLAVLLVSLCACAETPNAYRENDEEGFTVCVEFNANGGTFATNTAILTMSYNPAELTADAEGKAFIPLIAPDSTDRDGSNKFTPTKAGCFLVGWYAERNETGIDGEEVLYSYADKWDFENDRLEVDVNAAYTAEKPALVLYAAWLPLFEVRFCSVADGSVLGTCTYDPTAETVLSVPEWNEQTGKIDMHQFPILNGKTFNAAYYDSECTLPVSDTVVHSGVIDYENAVAVNPIMELYVDYTDGEWYHIHTAKQFIDNAKPDGCYEICADLDFDGLIWPTSFVYGSFSGTVNGNGHSFKNISVTQTNNSKVNAGLFGSLADTASISALTFDNAAVTIQAGTRVPGTSYGLFAGVISNGADIDGVAIKGSTLYIDSKCYFGTDDYRIGLVCGSGNASAVTEADISCLPTGSSPESVSIEINDNQITIDITTP